MERADAPTPSDRPVVTARQYLVRRIVAVFVLLAFFATVGFGLNWVVGMLSGSGDPTLVAAGADDTAEAATADSAPATGPVVTPDTSSTSPQSTIAPQTSAPDGSAIVPSPSTPARLTIYGDSHAGGFGPSLETQLDALGIVDSSLTYKVSSGLVRPDFFDWPAELPGLVAADRPDIAVVAWGGNDGQGVTIDGKAYPLEGETWAKTYTERIYSLLDTLTGAGARVIWVGVAIPPSEEFQKNLAVVRDVTETALANYKVPITYVDTWSIFAGVDGGYAEYVIDPRDGQGKDVRAKDGNHLNTNGAGILAFYITEAVKAELRDMGATI